MSIMLVVFAVWLFWCIIFIRDIYYFTSISQAIVDRSVVVVKVRRIDEYFLPSQQSVMSSVSDVNSVYPTVVAFGIDMRNMYRGDLMKAYDDYHAEHLYI